MTKVYVQMLGIGDKLIGDPSKAKDVFRSRDFFGFWQSYDDLVRKARNGKLAVEDFAGTTVSLTNPGTIGTVHSVPRLMPGQGAIVGVGAMGRGIAQIAAQAGSTVRLFDMQPEAIRKAHDAIAAQWDKLAEKGRISPEQLSAYKARLQPANSLKDLSDCDMVVEAIVEHGLKALSGDLLSHVLVRATKAAAVTCSRAGANPPTKAEIR